MNDMRTSGRTNDILEFDGYPLIYSFWSTTTLAGVVFGLDGHHAE